MTRKYTCTHEPDPIQALREIAPDGAKWFCTDKDGDSWYQNKRGKGEWWVEGDGTTRWVHFHEERGSLLSLTAIDLQTGTVHLQRPDGTIIEVTRKEWEKMP